MDRWRSGTPETCHSSHHPAICTPSPSFSTPHPSIRLFLRSCYCHSSSLSSFLSFFLFLPSSIFLPGLWQSFLGFIISSGDIPPSLSPSALRSLGSSRHFHFLCQREQNDDNKKDRILERGRPTQREALKKLIKL